MRSLAFPTIITAAAAFATALATTSVAPAAERERIEGPWQQVETSAGACPNCGLTIARQGTTLAVTATNGWTATVAASAGDTDATGTGVWSITNRGWPAGRPFTVGFRLAKSRLYMDMQVEMPGGSRRHIRAVFERVWLGA